MLPRDGWLDSRVSAADQPSRAGAGEEVASLGLADGPAGGLAVAGARSVAGAGHRRQVGLHAHEVV